MPNTRIELSVAAGTVFFDILIPLTDLEVSLGQTLELPQDDTLVANYVRRHLCLKDFEGHSWHLALGSMLVISTTDQWIGEYKEIQIQVAAQPPPASAVYRRFILEYDLVIHQISTHRAIVHIRQDWENGILSPQTEIAVLGQDAVTGQILPLVVQLKSGNWRRGFRAMFLLGMQHIAEGTDHVMFLSMLLLVAPLHPQKKRWRHRSGLRSGLFRVLKIVTAFTLGHSLTLAVCSMKWLPFSSFWIESIVAISILVAAVHAILPVFGVNEIAMAGIFGLFHGMAFSDTLTGLQLDQQQLLLSIVGFNIGIESIQVFITVITIPWLFLLSRSGWYRPFRMGVAFLSSIAAIAWIVQRSTGTDVYFLEKIEMSISYAPYLLGGLILLSVSSWLMAPKAENA